jgi:alpha-1,2-mannosyltransferase
VNSATRMRTGIAIVASICALAFLTMVFLEGSRVDFRVYLTGADALLDGVPLYGDVGIQSAKLFLPFTYPPFAAVALIPFALVANPVALTVWFLLSLAALVGIAVMTATRLPALANRTATKRTVQQLAVLVFVLAAISEPISKNFILGQVNLLIVVALMYDTLNRTRFTGYLTGIAAGFKVTPGIFILFMLATRRWADAGRAIVGLVATLIIGALFGVNQVVEYWTSVLFDVSRVGDSERLSNVSLQGAIYRILGDDSASRLIWLALAVIILSGGIVVATFWWNRSRLLAAGIVGLTSVVISPVSWVHHWVWVVPVAGACAALAVRARGHRPRGVFAALVAAALLTGLPPIIQWRYQWTSLLPFSNANNTLIVGVGYAMAAVATIALLVVALRLPKGSYEPDPPPISILREQPTDAR